MSRGPSGRSRIDWDAIDREAEEGVFEDKELRTAHLTLDYDLGGDIEGHVLGASFTDYAHGRVDELTIRLEDSESLWSGPYFPGKGDEIRGYLICADWPEPGRQYEFDCGVFTIDEINLRGGRNGDEVEIKAVSVFVTKPLRAEKKSRAWENTTFENIVKEIARDHGLSLFFEIPKADSLVFDRVDQRGESDLAFLRRFGSAQGCNVKLAEEKLIIFEGRNFDAKPAAFTITRGKSEVIAHDFKAKTADIFKSCAISYWDIRKKELKEYTFTPKGAPKVGQTLKIDRRVDSLGSAMKRAKSELRRKNKAEFTAEIELVGAPYFRAGLNTAVSGWGAFDAVYFIEKVEHRIAQGGDYTTCLSIRKTLGY